jgi:hypothetical protein
MRIEILEEAERDLIEGFQFYENQEAGLGSYFRTNLYADIESLKNYAGIHSKALQTVSSVAIQEVSIRHLLQG